MPIPEFVVELRRHMGKAPLWLIGSTAVIVRDVPEAGPITSGEVLLVKRADSGSWSPVTGIVDPGEDPHVTAVREAQEEASVQARVERLVWVCAGGLVTYANGDQTRYLDHTFLCHWESGEPAVGDDENLDARWFRIGELPEMAPAFARRIEVALSRPEQTMLGPGPDGIREEDIRFGSPRD
ncbi:MAG: NUDIX domain-containing protein [Dermatophilus congolensis]|nr:NUDIX domain-containing protein [Dermatophilus congolensis]